VIWVSDCGRSWLVSELEALKKWCQRYVVGRACGGRGRSEEGLVVAGEKKKIGIWGEEEEYLNCWRAVEH
jgi:hypothetical protein